MSESPKTPVDHESENELFEDTHDDTPKPIRANEANEANERDERNDHIKSESKNGSSIVKQRPRLKSDYTDSSIASTSALESAEHRPSSISSDINLATSISNDGIISPDRMPSNSITTNMSNMTQRLRSPFQWLSRNPASTEKRTSQTNSPIGEDKNGLSTASNLSTLKERFQALREREENLSHQENSDADSKHDEAISPPMSPVNEINKENRSRSSSLINPNLPPGTASGIVEGPTIGPPINWDLWQEVVIEGPTAILKRSSEELTEAISSGIPQPIRGVLWQVFANSKNEGTESFYRELVARGTDKDKSSNGIEHGADEKVLSSASSIHSEKSIKSPGSSHDSFTNPIAPKPKSIKEEFAHIQVLEKAIKRDMGARTSYSKYLMSSGLQDGLFGICKAYALYDEEVGYAQGMNFIAMPLLFNMKEEEAFCLFVKIMSKYGLRQMFTNEMPGLHLINYQFERILEDIEPSLYYHLNRKGVSPNLYATQWFLTLFSYRFPLQLVQRIYDLILSSNLALSILKFAIILMQKNKDSILKMQDMSLICSFLKEKIFDIYIDKSPSSSSILESGFFGSSTGGIDKEVYRADDLVKDACSVPITMQQLDSYQQEWEERIRIERDKEFELENLKNQVSNLTKQVRTLEERVEKSDQEHVAIAQDLVRTKVDNEALNDENESFKTRIEELMKVIDTQKEEVERTMRIEMNEVMKRNLEVHESNRSLEEERTELEKILVSTRLQHAQLNEEHDSLKQKWNTIAQMMK